MLVKENNSELRPQDHKPILATRSMRAALQQMIEQSYLQEGEGTQGLVLGSGSSKVRAKTASGPRNRSLSEPAPKGHAVVVATLKSVKHIDLASKLTPGSQCRVFRAC